MKKLFDLKSKLIPLGFGIFIVTSFMYVYDNNLTLVFLLCSIIMQSLIYVFYDYISAKSKIMQYISILGSLIAMLLLIIIIGSLYNTSNMIDFMVWFLSPQGVVDYSLQYIFVMLVGLNFFVSSTIYYFTQVRYRMITTFFLLLIPFAMFTKEEKDIPIMFLLPLIVLYFSTLIVCGQNNLYKQNNVKVIENKSYFKSVGTFVLTFMLISSAVPKPQIVANRDTFETLINANNFTNYLLSQLGDFTDTSNGTGFSFLSSNRVLFTVETSGTISLKARTFSSYNFNKNVWLRTDGVKSKIENADIDTTLNYSENQTDLVNYDRYGDLLSDSYINDFEKSLNPAELLNAIVYACNQDKTFTEKYNLTDINLQNQFTPSIKSIRFQGAYKPFTVILNPTNTFEINPLTDDDATNTIDLNIFSTYSGIYYQNDDDNLINLSKYSLNYYSSDILYDSNTLDILSNLSFDIYGDFLNDLNSIVKGSQFETVVHSHLQDYTNAVTYSTIFPSTNNNKILSLAKDITKDCNSDIEKAFALQNYFISNGYNYDANYQQPKNATIENFLFENKTGACYEYSTSMVLMARALGLPARYVEGFLVDNPSGKNEPIQITANSSHAYPEVYISGYGWCYFEPTQVLLGIEEDIDEIELSENYKLFVVSLCIILVVILSSLFIMFVYPKFYEKYFRKKVLTKSLKESLNLIIYRIRKITQLPDTQTLEELQKYLMNVYHMDIINIVELSNKVFYSNTKMDICKEKELIQNCLNDYILLYNNIIETNKQQKKVNKKLKKVKN